MPEVDAKLIFARHAERTLRIFGQEIEALLLCEEEHQHAVYENHLVFAFRPLYCQDALLYSEFVLVGISIPADAVFPTTKHGILAFGQILRDVHQDVLAFVETIRSGMNLGDLYAESGQTLQASFSAISKPNFATKYALESSRRDLHNALLRTAL